MIEELCRLAAELADEVEKNEPDVVHCQLKIKCYKYDFTERIAEPTTLEITALWEGGEWKWTRRDRLETWEPIIVIGRDGER